MPCTNKAVWDLVVKPSGDNVSVCDEHKTITALDLEKNGEIVLSKVDPASSTECAYLTDDDLRKLLL